MHEVNAMKMASGVSVPCVGRSESPSQRSVALASGAESREIRGAGGTPPKISLDADPARAECSGDGDGDRLPQGTPCVGREDEPQHPGPRVRVRNLRIQLPAATADRIEALASRSGLARAHFVASALLIGVASLSSQIEGKRPG
jgi:hypothetical protein